MIFILALWNTAIAAVLAIALKLFGRTRWLQSRPALQHVLWIVVALKLITPPLIPVPVLAAESSADSTIRLESREPGASAPRTIPPDSVARREKTVVPVSEGSKLKTTAPPPVSVPGVSTSTRLWIEIAVFAIWGIGSAALFIVLFRTARTARRIVRLSTSSGELAETAAEIASRLPGRRCPIVVVDARVSPALLGWFNPAVILPRRGIEALDDTELRGVIAHELIHYQRRDHWVSAIAALIRAVVWWNPVAWWAFREIRLAQEHCCDSAVLSSNVVSARSYANALLKSLDLHARASQKRLAGAIELASRSSLSVRNLTRRIEMLSDRTRSARLSPFGISVLLSVVAVALCFPSVSQSQKKEERKADPKARRAEAKKTNNPFGLPTVAETFQGNVEVSGGAVAGAGIVRRIEKNDIHFRSGDYIKIDRRTKITVHTGGKLRFVNSTAIKPGMAIAYSIRMNRGTSAAVKVVLTGVLKETPKLSAAWNQIKKLNLEKLGGTKSSIDGRFPIRVQSKTGEVKINIGETKLIELPKPTLSVQWKQGKYRPEGVEDFEKFDFLLIEWLKNGRFTATCYRKPAK